MYNFDSFLPRLGATFWFIWLPLGLWKVVDIIMWTYSHLHIVID